MKPCMAGSANKVRMVATISPPMMATAIGPQNTDRESGIMASTAGRCGRQDDWPQPPHGTLHNGIPGGYTGRPVLRDLVNQDDGVAQLG